MDVTKVVSVTTTGREIFEFDVEDIQSLTIVNDAAAKWGFSSLDQAVFPLLAYGNIAISHADFTEEQKQERKRVLMFGKADAGTVAFHIAYIGKGESR